MHDIVQNAALRQQVGSARYVDRVLRHLVHATFGPLSADERTDLGKQISQHSSAADFLIGDVTVHVAQWPGERVIEKCRDDIGNGFRPMLVTMEERGIVAQELAGYIGLRDQIDVFEIEQFVALNLRRIGGFEDGGCKRALTDFITRYNRIVVKFESDPSFVIELLQ